MRLLRFFLISSVIFTATATLFAQETETQIDAPRSLQVVPPDIPKADLLVRMSELYQVEAEILQAAARDEVQTHETLLGVAMDKLASLVTTPEITNDQRFRELYRTIVTEYESYYGVSDTLELPNGSIVGVHDEMFAMLNSEALVETVALPDLKPMATEIPMDINRLVEQSITYLLKNPEKTVDLWRPRADTYMPMIEQILREEGVPDEMKYLAMIESGLNPKARSWARANGMWQFIAGTGAMYNLKVNRWVDERLDPEKATRAAARHLKDLFEMFDQDWHLAMAGYNCSPGRVKRAIRQTEARLGRKATFWDIYRLLPRETRGYVPMFIATALMISNPDAFDLNEAEQGQRYEYDYVGIKHVMSLTDVARMAGTSVSTIRALNPEIRRSATPPMQGVYPLRVPIGSGETFLAKYQDWAKDHPPTRLTHSVRRGDSLGKIAARYGVSITALKNANGIRGTTIHPGQVFAIPYSSYSSETAPEIAESKPVRVSYGGPRVLPVAVTGVRGPDPKSDGSIEKLASTTKEEADAAIKKTPTRTASTTGTSNNRIRYRVRRGDSLGKIAARYGVSISSLRNWNNIRGSRIYAGQYLSIYQNGNAPASASSTYRVRRGDSLYVIARKYGVSIRQLKSWNNLVSNTIRPGQVLKVAS